MNIVKYCKCGCETRITNINPKTKVLRDYINGHNVSIEMPGKYERNKKWRKRQSLLMKTKNPMKIKEAVEKRLKSWKGYKHSQEIRKRISKSVKNSYDDKLRETRRKQIIERMSKGINNDTDIERIIENQLLFSDILYIKQFRYKLGIADFWLPETNTIVECDGDYWHSLPGKQEHDKKQTEWLENNDFEVIRLTETQIKRGDFDSVFKY